jgi:hypothetical protein
MWEEPAWEYFVPDIKIDLNGTRLYGTGSRNVSSYHNESYQEGIYENPDDALNALDKYIDLDSLSRREYAPTLRDSDMKEALNAFMEQPDVQASLQLREQSREAQRIARMQEQQSKENERQHWERVNDHGGFIHVDVHPSQVHPVKSQKALSWDKRYQPGNERLDTRGIQDGPASATNSAPVWVDVAKDKRIFVPSGLLDRREDNTYQVTMEPNNTKKVFTGASLKGEDVQTSEIADMLAERSVELDSKWPSGNFVTVPSSNVVIRQRRSDGATFGVVTLPTNGLGEHADTMSFAVDSRQIKEDPAQAGSVVINLNRKTDYKVQYTGEQNREAMLGASDLTGEIAQSMSNIAQQNAEASKKAQQEFVADIQMDTRLKADVDRMNAIADDGLSQEAEIE